MRFWDSLGKFFETIIFVKFTLPVIILIIVGMLVWQGFYGSSVNKKYEDDPNIILTSEFISTVCDVARRVNDSSHFSKVKGSSSNSDTVRTYSAEVEYYFRDGNKSVEEFEQICKNELTKVFNELKGKKVVKNQIFADTESMSIGLVFWCPTTSKTYNEIDGVYYDVLCSEVLFYKEENGFDENLYNKQMSNKILTQEHLDFIHR